MGGGDLWELLIQGPANAHIHEDLELPLQLQRSVLCFPLRMPSSTPNTVRSLFLSYPTHPHHLLFPNLPPPSLPTLFFFFRRICTPPNPLLLSSAELANASPFIYSFASRLPLLLSSPLLFTPPLSHSITPSISPRIPVWIRTVCCAEKKTATKKRPVACCFAKRGRRC